MKSTDTIDGKRLCKICNNLLPISAFPKHVSGKRYLTCKSDVKKYTQRDPIAYRTRDLASHFCRKVLGTKCCLTRVDLCVLERVFRVRDMRLVPADPSLPLDRRNLRIVSPKCKILLCKLWRNTHDKTLYEMVVNKSSIDPLQVDVAFVALNE